MQYVPSSRIAMGLVALAAIIGVFNLLGSVPLLALAEESHPGGFAIPVSGATAFVLGMHLCVAGILSLAFAAALAYQSSVAWLLGIAACALSSLALADGIIIAANQQHVFPILLPYGLPLLLSLGMLAALVAWRGRAMWQRG